MKKIILLTLITIFSISSYAQVSFGAQLGANLGMAKLEQDQNNLTSKYKTDPKAGFLIGVVADIPFGKTGLSFRPELNFIQKGFTYDQTEFNGYFYYNLKNKTTTNYIELPLNVMYNLHLGSGKLFFGLGPNISFGLSGKNKATASAVGYEDEEYKNDIKFDGKKNAIGDDKHLKRVDFGGDILAGYQMGMGLSLNIGYTLGFNNIDPENNLSWKNRSFCFKIGYMFGGKDNKGKKK